jgi:hypothetical protein
MRMEADHGSAEKFENSGHWECFVNGRPVVEQAGGITSSASTIDTGREREYSERKQRLKSLVFRSRELFELMESLILAQDERWRRA